MKKIFKIVGIIVIVIVVLIGGLLAYYEISDSLRAKKLYNERINADTLMEYVKTHSWEYLDCSDSNCLEMHFKENKFICDIDYNNIKDFQSDYFVTKNNEIYDISFDKLYSNNQNCKKREIDIDVSNIQDYYIFSKNNKIYNVRDLEEEYITDYSQIYLLDKNIIKIISSDYDNGKINVLVFKDNNIYKQTYNITNGENGFNKITFEKEELYKSLEEYGNIKYITFEPYLYTNSGKNIQLEENTITTIFSDKGYYYLDEVKTDECTKYKDIDCELELKESEIYKKFSKDIKYVGQKYTILTDNSIIETNYLTYPLDKDLRN